MNAPGTTQPLLRPQALGMFAKACISLFHGSDDASFDAFASHLAELAQCDLVLFHENDCSSGALRLLSQFGLLPEEQSKLQMLTAGLAEDSADRCAIQGDVRQFPDGPLRCALSELGMRACCVYPVRSDGHLKGQLLLGSRRWDMFHDDTLVVFVASADLMASALVRRKAAAKGFEPTWKDVGKEDPASKQRQFIAVLAHELRNPIAPIRSGMDLLSTELLDAEGRRTTLQMMQRQVAHLTRLIDDLLDTARLDTGRLQVKRQPALLGDVVRSAIESIRPALAAKSQALRLDDAAAQVVVDVDPVRLAQAFANILSANVGQTPEGGVISVSVAAEGAEFAITFEDQGQGSDMKDIDNVFELFPNSAEQHSEEAWGIGLALVRGLVELNGGRVERQRRAAGNGDIYTVWLPHTDLGPDALAASQSADDAAAAAGPSHRLLVVDDNRDAAQTLGLLFELDGHTVRIAFDGPSAVSEAHEFQPEVVLMDIGLPGFDGNEATKQIRAHQSAVRPLIIALTGWGAEADKDATHLAGFDMHFVKPVPHEKLRQTIFKFFNDQRQGQQNV